MLMGAVREVLRRNTGHIRDREYLLNEGTVYRRSWSLAP